MRTYFQEFKMDSGTKVTAEYSYSAGSETTYSPMHGASGGDPCEVSILKVMPNTGLYDWLCKVSLNDGVLSGAASAVLRFLENWHFPNTEERERMEAWIIENIVPDHDDYFEEDFREA